ncbi:nucleotidyltransferase [bacterium]|nr:nucleotidyltransferase [bacterium]
MSFDESFLSSLVEALAQAKLQVIFIGNAAAILHGVPVLTQDVDLFVRDHPQLKSKLQRFTEIFEVTFSQPYEPFSKIIRAQGKPVEVDFVFALSSGKSFESIRSRAARVRIGRRMAWVAALEDVIAAKEAAGRKKDMATLPILKDALRVKNAIRKERNKSNR